MDSKAESGWEACFEQDAVLVVEPGPGVERQKVVLNGRAAIASAFTRTADRLPQQQHQVSLRSFARNGATAQTESTFVRLDAAPSGPVVGSFGRYVDSWVRTHGAWRISSRTIRVDSSIPERRLASEAPDVSRAPAEVGGTVGAIRDVILAYCRAMDRRDYDRVRACYHDDATDHHGAYVGGVDGFIERIRVELPKCERTFHMVGNLIVDEVTSTAARCESYVLAYHRLPPHDSTPARDRVVALRYLDRFELRSGAWRIAERICACEWTRTDPVLPGWDFGAENVRGVPGPGDPLFDDSRWH